jgi:hypothetical protein
MCSFIYCKATQIRKKFFRRILGYIPVLKNLFWKNEGKIPLGRSRCRCEDIITEDLKGIV